MKNKILCDFVLIVLKILFLFLTGIVVRVSQRLGPRVRVSNIPFTVPQLVQNVRYKFLRERRTGNRILDLTGRIILLTVAQLKNPFTNHEHDLRDN